ncbi:MAG: NYN domain-containing protein [Pirellulaceae bacterium]
MELLIDGYNLLHQSPSMTVDRGPGWTQRARSRLLHWLAHYLPAPVQAQTLVVFDAPKRPSKLDLDPDGSQPAGNLRTDGSAIVVRFAIGYPEADQLLIELIAKHSHPGKLLVVSSDRAIRTAAQRRRSEHQASQQWTEALLARSPQALPPRFRQLPSDRSQPALEAGKPPISDSNFNWIAWFGLEDHQTPAATVDPVESSPTRKPLQETTSASDARRGLPAKEPPSKEPPAKEPPAKEQARAADSGKKRRLGKPPQLPPDWRADEFLDS